MSEATKSLKLVKRSPGSDVLVLLTCLSLTVFFDMVIAITAGILLASLLFMKELAALTQVIDITDNRDFVHKALPANCKVFKIRGALFFAAADRIFGELSQQLEGHDGIVLHMQYSAYLDAGGLSAIEKLISYCEKKQIPIRFSSWQFQPLKTLARARTEVKGPLDLSFSTLDEAIDNVITTGK
ncbi:STAS domain-containing protein [Oceanicoccus sp. KOV_DT_Chl]|uniref:STAS domain-containing protein n=1 Tax=Oceanicoccus sp. KOV_DT_Chl TaxID=1904639 RepID=UPI0035108720